MIKCLTLVWKQFLIKSKNFLSGAKKKIVPLVLTFSLKLIAIRMPILSGIRISKLIRFPESLTSIRRGDFPWFEFWCLLLLYVICVFSGNSLQSLKVHKWVAIQKYRYVNRNEIKSIISTYLCIVIKHLFDFVTNF